MKFYRVKDDEVVRWYPTIGGAQAGERATIPKVFWPSMVIEEIEVPTDKAGVLALLRGDVTGAALTSRKWKLTNRGGLKSLAE